MLVSVLLMLNFSLPLVAIYKDPGLREETTPLLICNLALVDFVQGALSLFSGILNAVHPEVTVLPACLSILYVAVGNAVAAKTATLFLAIDQFVAVHHSLRYKTIMGEWIQEMLLITWCWIPSMALFGFVCHQLGWESSQNQRVFGEQVSDEKCHWVKLNFAATFLSEVIALLMVMTTTALFAYTATKGIQQERRDNLNGSVDQTSHSFVRFKSFKRIVKVMLTVLTVDIIFALFRITSRGEPEGALNQLMFVLRVLFLVVEGWVYGLSHPANAQSHQEALRSAISPAGCPGERRSHPSPGEWRIVYRGRH